MVTRLCFLVMVICTLIRVRVGRVISYYSSDRFKSIPKAATKWSSKSLEVDWARGRSTGCENSLKGSTRGNHR